MENEGKRLPGAFPQIRKNENGLMLSVFVQLDRTVAKNFEKITMYSMLKKPVDTLPD